MRDNKRNILIGATAGLIVLSGVVAWSVFANRQNGSGAADARHQQSAEVTARADAPGNPGQGGVPAGSPPAPAAQTMQAEERDKLKVQIQTRLSDIQAKGTAATPKETVALLDDVQKLAGDQFDKQYFQTLREILGKSARVQELNQEMQRIKDSRVPKDVERTKVILAELQQLSEALVKDSTKLQQHAPKIQTSGGAP